MATVALQRQEHFHCESPRLQQEQSVVEGAIYWYEEETVVEDEYDYEGEYNMESEVEFTEVTYESECPTEDDILLGTLPPAPPLTEHCELTIGHNDVFSEQRLLDAMRRKRDEVPTKTTIPGTRRDESRPMIMKNKQTNVSLTKERSTSSALPLEVYHHSPTGVWEDLHVQESHESEKEEPEISVISTRRHIKAPPRVKKIDEILLRHDERRAFAVPSADPRQQCANLEKVWRKKIVHQVASMGWHLHSIEREMMKIESNLTDIRKHNLSSRGKIQ